MSFRLHDSLPQTLLNAWREALASLPDGAAELERRKRIDAALDAGHGQCWLQRPEIAALVEQALLFFDGERYQLHAWVIMPNHVHVLFTPLHGNSLSSILHSWKSFTAKAANRQIDRQGAFWMEEYFDRAIRDDRHFQTAIEYIENNPVKAGLCETAADWRWSSQSLGERDLGARASCPPMEEERAGRPRSQELVPLSEGGLGARAYAEAVGVYLALGVDRLADRSSTICGWDTGFTKIRNTFGRQAIPMTWDYAEGNAFSSSRGIFLIYWSGV